MNTAHTQRGTTLHTLVTALEACVSAEGHASLPARAVGLLRAVLASWQAKRGLPGGSPSVCGCADTWCVAVAMCGCGCGCVCVALLKSGVCVVVAGCVCACVCVCVWLC